MAVDKRPAKRVVVARDAVGCGTQTKSPNCLNRVAREYSDRACCEAGETEEGSDGREDEAS